jgi:hypothetical protein
MEVCYVVKRTPFEVFLEVEDLDFDFKTGKIECELFYAKPKEEKGNTPVSAIGNKTFEFTAHPVPHDARKCKIEFRINVLTTQHNNLNFKLRIRLSKGKNFVEVFTKAIHSCSKLAQIRRKVEEARQNGGDDLAQVKAKKKRARCDDLIDKLQRIEDIQSTHTRLLHSIALERDHSTDSLEDAFPWQTGTGTAHPVLHANHFDPMASVKDQPVTLEHSLLSFLDAYGAVSGPERPAKLRRIVADLPPALQHLANNVGFFLSIDPTMRQTVTAGARPLEGDVPVSSSSDFNREPVVTVIPNTNPQMLHNYFGNDLYCEPDQQSMGNSFLSAEEEMSTSSYDPAM